MTAFAQIRADIARPVSRKPVVFPTSTGAQLGQDNFLNRVMAPAGQAGERDARRRKTAALPDRLTPQSLRRTVACVLYGLGESPLVVMIEMGRGDPQRALRVDAQAMRGDDAEAGKLRGL